MLIIKSNRVEIMEHKLTHIQSRSNILMTKLHDQVLVMSLALSDRNIGAKLENRGQ